ncbi:MAG: GntR family transcriptional regulator [Verrucomicrobiales bacterium]|nr:GntR family transcriptional regulator [Verrucomicrobiales bacterium]
MVLNETLSERAYAQLHKKLVNGDFKAGSVVSEELLARQLGMSRTPIREAIRRLRMEGFVEQVPRRGTVVRSIDRQDVEEQYEVRIALESHAAARAARQITEGDLQVLERLCNETHAITEKLRKSGKRALDARELQRLLAMDMAFHMVLIRASGNHRIMKIIGESRVLTRMFEGYGEVYHDLNVVSRADKFHRKILNAVKAKDSELTRCLMVEHLSIGKCDAVAVWDAHQQKSATRPRIAMPHDLLDELGDIEVSWNQ